MADLVSFEEFRKFWEENPTVVIDSCSLLDLYRYAPNASKRILKNLIRIQDNIWLPSQVLEEYRDNKDSVIKAAHKKFENVSEEVQRIIKDADKNITSKFHRYGKFRYPNINAFRDELEEIISSLAEKAKNFKQVVATEIQENKESLKEDEVNSLIQTLEELGQTGVPFSFPKILEIYREGTFRYNHLIPPGYKDIDKDLSDPTKTQKFGDLIIWKELLNKSTESQDKFIFITDDEKEDWWNLKVHNTHLGERKELIGPRKELVSEFNAVSQSGKNGFIMLTLPEFNRHISKINEVNLKEVYLNDIELDTEKLVREIIDSKDWQLILDSSSELTNSFIHDGELQELTGEILTDVEIHEILDPAFESLYVDYNEDDVVIEGSFSCRVTADIETALSSEYRETTEIKLLITGNLTIEFNLEYDEENDTVERIDDTVSVSGITIIDFESPPNENDYSDIACTNCGIRPGSYFTNEGDHVCGSCIDKFDICPGCGQLFELGTLGGYKCDNCADD